MHAWCVKALNCLRDYVKDLFLVWFCVIAWKALFSSAWKRKKICVNAWLGTPLGGPRLPSMYKYLLPLSIHSFSSALGFSMFFFCFCFVFCVLLPLLPFPSRNVTMRSSFRCWPLLYTFSRLSWTFIHLNVCLVNWLLTCLMGGYAMQPYYLLYCAHCSFVWWYSSSPPLANFQ